MIALQGLTCTAVQAEKIRNQMIAAAAASSVAAAAATAGAPGVEDESAGTGEEEDSLDGD